MLTCSILSSSPTSTKRSCIKFSPLPRLLRPPCSYFLHFPKPCLLLQAPQGISFPRFWYITSSPAPASTCHTLSNRLWYIWFMYITMSNDMSDHLYLVTSIPYPLVSLPWLSPHLVPPRLASPCHAFPCSTCLSCCTQFAYLNPTPWPLLRHTLPKSLF